MSAFGRGLLSGLAGGLQGVEKFKEAETDYNRKMTLEEFRAAKEMEREKFREAYSRDIADQRAAIEVSEGAADRASRERIAGIAARNQPGIYLDNTEKKEGFKTVGLAIANKYPDLFPDEAANIFTLDPSKLTPTDINHVLTKVNKEAAKNPELAPLAEKLREWSKIGSNPRLSWEELQQWTDEVIDLLGTKEDPLGLR